MRKYWMFLLFIAVSVAFPAFARPQAGTMLHKGKKGDIAVTTTLHMDGVKLEPGEYTVQHRTSGSDHFLRLQKWEEVSNTEAAGTQVPFTVGGVKCEVQPAKGTITETRVYTEKKGGETWITKIEVKGENVVHIIPTK